MTAAIDKARQAALKQEYKMGMPPIGIYVIRNTRTGKVLLDASRNVPGALNRHCFELRQGTHRNKALLADWKQLGESCFAFEAVDLIEQKAEPDFDYQAELQGLLELWREKHPAGAPGSYH